MRNAPAHAQIVFECHLLAVELLRQAWPDALDEARAAAGMAMYFIPFQRHAHAVDGQQGCRRADDAVGCRACPQGDVMAFHDSCCHSPHRFALLYLGCSQRIK